MAKNKKQSNRATLDNLPRPKERVTTLRLDNLPRPKERVTTLRLDNLPRYVEKVTTMEPKKLVSEAALKRRINRKLAKDGQALRTSRNWQMEMEAGHHYVVDFSHGGVIQSHVDLEDLGRELGVLKPYEYLAD